MSAPRFAVETIRGSLVVITEDVSLNRKFVAAAEKKNLNATAYHYTQIPDHFEDVDNCLIFMTPTLTRFFFGEGRIVWEKLSRYPHPYLYCVQRAWEKLPIELPTQTTSILLGEYLGFDQLGAPTLNKIVSALKSSSEIVLSDGGLAPYSLMSEDYLVEAIITIVENQQKLPQINLANPQSLSLLTLIQFLISNQNKAMALSYSQDGLTPATPESFYHTTYDFLNNLISDDTKNLAYNYFAQSETQQQETIKSPPQQTKPTLSTLRPVLTPPPISQPKKKNTHNYEFVPERLSRDRPRIIIPPHIRNSRVIKLVLSSVKYVALFYFASLVLSVGIALVTIFSFKKSFNSGAYEKLVSNPVAEYAGDYLYSNFSFLRWQEGVILSDLYRQSLAISDTFSSLTTNTSRLASYVFTEQGDNLASNLTTTRLNIENLYQQLSLLDGTMPLEPPRLLSRYSQQYLSFKHLLPNLKKQTLLAKGVASILPELIASGDRAKYLVLFQNNMELRATGGFIGSYGIISFENGKLYDFQVYDVYTADGVLKGHVEPPPPIKNILGEANWYLRDSNFDPDFPTSARRAEWFLKKSMNLDVQGTIGVNLETLRALLEVVGPLNLADYNESVTAENLAERAQYHAEVNFFPGSTAKKEFLSSVADNLFQKLKSSDPKTLLRLAGAVSTTLESSDTQLSFLAPTIEKVMYTLGWNGIIETRPCPTTPCFDDYLSQIDSNFGVNKANFYINKDSDLKISINKDGLPSYQLTTTWYNTAKSSAWPAGVYKNFTRVYLPSSAVVSAVTVDNRVLKTDEYTISQEHGKTVLSYLVSVPIDSSVSSVVTYTNSTPIQSGSFYSLYYQRQSGANPRSQTTTTIEYPIYLKPSKIAPSATAITPQSLKFEFALDLDHRISIQF